MQRRDFCKAGGTAIAALALAPGLLRAAPARAIKKAIMLDTLGLKGTVEERFKAMKEAGFDGVEPLSHMNQDEVVKALEASGLKAASVCCATHWKDTLSDPSAAVRERGFEGLKQALRDAKRYGASSVLLVPGVVNKSVTYDECWQRSVAEIRKALPLAEELGVKIAIENVGNKFITKPEQAVAYVDEFKSPMVGFHFDVGNFLRFSPPESWIAALGKRILKLHLKEWGKAKGFDVEFFGGDNNWPAIMKAVDAIGYEGWAITEMPGKQTKDLASLKSFSEKVDRILAS